MLEEVAFKSYFLYFLDLLRVLEINLLPAKPLLDPNSRL